MEDGSVIKIIADWICRPPKPPGWAGFKKTFPPNDRNSEIVGTSLYALNSPLLSMPNTVFRKFRHIHRQMLLHSPVDRILQ
ncbi:hypothetical protein DESC_190081 [Desulfosarcina cetonica]|nr:hypothetical protein DESC_190081 [Desulfosarcina cetonica]